MRRRVELRNLGHLCWYSRLTNCRQCSANAARSVVVLDGPLDGVAERVRGGGLPLRPLDILTRERPVIGGVEGDVAPDRVDSGGERGIVEGRS